MAEQKAPLIQMEGIVKRFYIGHPNELEILHGIDLTVQEGEFLAIVGESGSGKSTMMNITGALDSATGRVVMDIFHKLHREQGKTILLITHSQELAAECERIVTLLDGEIVSERKGGAAR